MEFFWAAFRGAVTAIVVLIFFGKWAFAKADEKYDVMENPFKHCLRFVGFSMIPVLPALLVVNVLCAYFF
jgi:hypothetical protein